MPECTLRMVLACIRDFKFSEGILSLPVVSIGAGKYTYGGGRRKTTTNCYKIGQSRRAEPPHVAPCAGEGVAEGACSGRLRRATSNADC